MGCNVDPDKVSADQPNDDEGIEQVEGMVRTTNRSMAAMSGAWLRRKVHEPWARPWMRGAPQSGLSTLIRRISARMSAWICGSQRQ
jgi:hypothetical protein